MIFRYKSYKKCGWEKGKFRIAINPTSSSSPLSLFLWVFYLFLVKIRELLPDFFPYLLKQQFVQQVNHVIINEWLSFFFNFFFSQSFSFPSEQMNECNNNLHS